MSKTDIQQVKLRFGIIGNDEDLCRAIDVAMQVAPTDLSVLITGESGVGKENFPKIIHQNSARKHAPYIAVNCGAIPEGTIDSELFGHEKGSFTGAISDRKGYFGEANNGTIFLDEAGELPLSTQARLLRVLESGEFIKVGSSKVEKTNVRIVAATNVNMAEAISAGRFREDLYYRLNTVPIHIPPLRNRGGDIVLLFRKFAADFAERYRMPAIILTEEAKKILLKYQFPGNIRQLKNIVEQISIIEREREIDATVLQTYLPLQQSTHSLLPILRNAGSGQHFENERDILYKVLWDMRDEIENLKQLVINIQNGIRIDTLPTTDPASVSKAEKKHATHISLTNDIQEAEVFEEDDTAGEGVKSLAEIEREAIVSALAKADGNRRQAAQMLKIPERTLYRRIEDYGLA